jgi:hypothetical protein
LVPSPGTTDALAEGSTNLYFSDEKVAAYGDVKYIPYNGANGDVNLGDNSLTSGKDANINGVTIGLGGGQQSLNLVIGAGAGAATMSGGGGNTYIGTLSGSTSSSGSLNTAVGYHAGCNITTGNSNTFFGTYTGGYGSITGDGNSAFGQAAGANLTSGSSNTFVGAGVGVMVTTGSNNTVVGGNSGGSGNVNNITAFGAGAGGGSTGDNNNFIGVAAGGNPFGTGGPLSGDYNTLIGDYAGANGATAEKNIAIGYGALTRMLSASSNIAIGYGAGWHTNSGDLTTNSNSIYIGSDTKPLANGDSNEVAIGYQAIGLGSDTTVIGNDSTTLTGIYGMLSGMADNRSLYDDNSYIQKGYADDTYGAIAGADINVNNEWHFNQHLWSETGLYIRSRTSSHYWVNYVDNDDYKIYNSISNEDVFTINHSTGKSSFSHGVGCDGNLEVVDGIFNIKSSVYGDNYRTQLGNQSGRGHLVLGNNSTNIIQAGTTGTGGTLEFWVNNTNNFPDIPNGLLAMRMEADGSIRTYHDFNVNGNLTVSGTTSIGQVTFGSSTSAYPISMGTNTNSARSIIISNNGGDSYIGNESSVAGGALLYGNNAFALCILTSNNRDISFGTNNAEKLRLNASGVLNGSADYSSLYSNNSYIQKVYADAHYLTGYTENDPTVPSYAKSLTAFSVIKTSADALYQPILGYTAADDADIVHKTGDETIAGEKTLSSVFTVNNELIVAKNLGGADLSNFYGTNAFGKLLIGQNRSGAIGETNFMSSVGTSTSAYGGFSFINVDVEGGETILAQMKGDDGIFSTVAEIFSGGDIHVGGGSSKGIILQSPDSTYWRIKVSNTGVISASTI